MNESSSKVTGAGDEITCISDQANKCTAFNNGMSQKQVIRQPTRYA